MIERVVITNVKGIEFAEFKVGSLTVLTGANGTGKTSVLDAIRAVFEGGHDPSLIRKGAEFAVVDIFLEGGESITAKIEPHKTNRVVRDENGKAVKAPATYIEALASSFAFDPLGFLTAPPKERAAWLAAVMPIKVSADDVAAHLPNPKLKAKVTAMLPAKPMDLEGIAVARAEIYKARTGENAVAKRLSLTVDSLRGAIGDDDATNWAETAERDAGALAVARKERDGVTAAIQSRVLQFRREAALAAQGAKDAITSDTEKKIAALKDLAQEGYAAIDDNTATAVEEFQSGVELEGREQVAGINVTVEALEASLATAKEKAEQQSRNANTRQLAEKTEAEYRESMAKATLLDQAVEALDKAKAKALSATPIAGLEMADGEVLFEGIKFDQLNTQRQYELAIRIGAERLGKLPLMVTDYGEHLDAQKWAEFQQSVLDSGIQFIVARVSDGPLSIEAVEADGSRVG